jgi:cAMP-dependent protein kinase regulator
LWRLRHCLPDELQCGHLHQLKGIPMAEDVRALKDKATQLTARGKFSAALEAWRQVCAASPDDPSALQKVAEVQAKLGETANAVRTYEDVARRYAKKGLFFKASAVVRLVQNLAPGQTQLRDEVAEMFARGQPPKATPPPPPPAALAPQEFELEIEVELPPTKSGLPSIPLFSTLTQEELREVLGTAMEVRVFASGELLVREGAPGESMFALAEGQVGIMRGYGTPMQRRVAEASGGEVFGEVAMVSGAPRVATVVAETEVVALEFSKAAMTQVASRFPRVGQMVEQFAQQRLLANALRSNAILRGLPAAAQKELATRFRAVTFADGAHIISEGHPSGWVYLVLRGTCSAAHHSGDRYPDMREGDLFGEVSVLTDGVATATVAALGEVLCLRLSKEAFQTHVLSDPGARLAVVQGAKTRVERTEQFDARV